MGEAKIGKRVRGSNETKSLQVPIVNAHNNLDWMGICDVHDTRGDELKTLGISAARQDRKPIFLKYPWDGLLILEESCTID